MRSAFDCNPYLRLTASNFSTISPTSTIPILREFSAAASVSVWVSISSGFGMNCWCASRYALKCIRGCQKHTNYFQKHTTHSRKHTKSHKNGSGSHDERARSSAEDPASTGPKSKALLRPRSRLRIPPGPPSPCTSLSGTSNMASVTGDSAPRYY